MQGPILITTTEEALRDYFQRFHGSYGRSLLSYFTGAKLSTTVKDWCDGKYAPRGDYLLRVRCFLDLVGYRLFEFDELPEVGKRFARLIAFNIFTVTNACIALGYASEQQVYTFLLRGAGVKRLRGIKVQQIVQDNLMRIEEQTALWRPLIDELKALDKDGPLPEDSLLSQRMKEGPANRLSGASEPHPAWASPEATVERPKDEVRDVPMAGIRRPTVGGESPANGQYDTNAMVASFCHALLILDCLLPYVEAAPGGVELVRRYVPSQRLTSVSMFLDKVL